jgi:chemotaxis protein CheX
MDFERMQIEFVRPFVDGAFRVLRETIDASPRRGPLSLRMGHTFTSQELTTMIGVNGEIEGVALYGMSLIAGQKIAGKLMGMPVTKFDEIASSAISELANMITGSATTELEVNGYKCDITPPSLMWGIGAQITTTVPALIVPIITEFGDMEINLALSPATARQKQRALAGAAAPVPATR